MSTRICGRNLYISQFEGHYSSTLIWCSSVSYVYLKFSWMFVSMFHNLNCKTAFFLSISVCLSGLVWTNILCLLKIKLFCSKTTLFMLWIVLLLSESILKHQRKGCQMMKEACSGSYLDSDSANKHHPEASCIWVWPSRCWAQSAWLVTVSVTLRVTPGLSWPLDTPWRLRTTTPVPSHPLIKQPGWRIRHGVNVI